MTFNRVKLGRTLNFMIYLAIAISLIILPKTLICNKITLRLSNSLNLEKLTVNAFTNAISKKT